MASQHDFARWKESRYENKTGINQKKATVWRIQSIKNLGSPRYSLISRKRWTKISLALSRWSIWSNMLVLLRSDMGEYGWLIPTQTESMIYPQYQSIVLFQSTRHSNLSNSSLNEKESRGPVDYPCTECRSPGQRVAKPKNLRSMTIETSKTSPFHQTAKYACQLLGKVWQVSQISQPHRNDVWTESKRINSLS